MIVLSVSLAALATGDATADPKITPAQAGGYKPPKAKKGFKYPDCFCTNSTGKRIELGQTSCLTIGSLKVLARCSMSLNNPTWRRISNGCPNV